MSHLPVNEEILEEWQAIIDDNIPHTQDNIRVSDEDFKLSVKLYVPLVLLYLQEAGVDTLKVLCENYYCLDNTTIKRAQGGVCIELIIIISRCTFIDILIMKYIGQLKSQIHFARSVCVCVCFACPLLYVIS